MPTATPTTDHDENPEQCRLCGGPGPLEPKLVNATDTWPMCQPCRSAFDARHKVSQIKKQPRAWNLKGERHG